MSMENRAAISAKLVTTLVNTSKSPKASPYSEYAKETLQKLKSNNENERIELAELNQQFKEYLDDVKRLEDTNRQLIIQVDEAKKDFVPQEMDKSNLDLALSVIRQKLEDVSISCVQNHVSIEEAETMTGNFTEKIKFYQGENESRKQKIAELHKVLEELKSERDFVERAHHLISDDLRREKSQMEKADKDLAGLIGSLKENRLKKKRAEFEIETMLDEIAFRKALFREELEEMTKLHQVFSPSDLTNFYKNELLTAIRQIRQDFNNLNDQQIKDLKDQKERELNAAIHEAQYENMQLDLNRDRLNASIDLELQSSKELKFGLGTNNDEAKRLQQQQVDLLRRLSEIEKR